MISKKLAQEINKVFFEVIIANGFKNDALKILKKKKNIRIINLSNFNFSNKKHYLFLGDSFLLQDYDNILYNKKLKIVTKKKPTINQINVTLTDEHGNGIDALGEEVNMTLLFQYYRIPVLHKPIQDVRDRLRYLREMLINKKKGNSNNGKKKKGKETKAKAKAKAIATSNRVHPSTKKKEAKAQP